MQRPISRRQHGFVDYGVAALELVLSRVLPAKPATKRLLMFSGLNAAVLGALTKHELGLARVIPMRAHLALDAVFALTLLASPLFLDEDDPVVLGTLAALGVKGGAVAALTDPDRAD